MLEYCTTTALCVETYACLCGPAAGPALSAHTSPPSPGRGDTTSSARSYSGGGGGVTDFETAESDDGDNDVELQSLIVK